MLTALHKQPSQSRHATPAANRAKGPTLFRGLSHKRGFLLDMSCKPKRLWVDTQVAHSLTYHKLSKAPAVL